MRKVDAPLTFGAALRRARAVLRLDRATVARACRVGVRTVSRWESDHSWPGLEVRQAVLRVHARLPSPQLQELAQLAETTLAAAGIHEEPAPAPAPVILFSPSAQKAIDDAIREAAEDLGVHARELRPVASRFLDALARAGVSAEVGARMAIGIPKRPGKAESGAEAPGTPDAAP